MTNKGLNRPNQSSQVYLLPFGLFEVDIHKIPMFHHCHIMKLLWLKCWEKSQFFVVSSHLLMVSLMVKSHVMNSSTQLSVRQGMARFRQQSLAEVHQTAPALAEAKISIVHSYTMLHAARAIPFYRVYIYIYMYISMLFQSNRNQGLQKINCCHMLPYQASSKHDVLDVPMG